MFASLYLCLCSCSGVLTCLCLYLHLCLYLVKTSLSLSGYWGAVPDTSSSNGNLHYMSVGRGRGTINRIILQYNRYKCHLCSNNVQFNIAIIVMYLDNYLLIYFICYVVYRCWKALLGMLSRLNWCASMTVLLNPNTSCVLEGSLMLAIA